MRRETAIAPSVKLSHITDTLQPCGRLHTSLLGQIPMANDCHIKAYCTDILENIEKAFEIDQFFQYYGGCVDNDDDSESVHGK